MKSSWRRRWLVGYALAALFFLEFFHLFPFRG